MIRDLKMRIFSEKVSDVKEVKEAMAPIIELFKPHIDTCRDITIYSSYASKTKTMSKIHIYHDFYNLYKDLDGVVKNEGTLE